MYIYYIYIYIYKLPCKTDVSAYCCSVLEKKQKLLIAKSTLSEVFSATVTTYQGLYLQLWPAFFHIWNKTSVKPCIVTPRHLLCNAAKRVRKKILLV